VPRPGVEVTLQDAPPVRSANTDTSRWFFADFAHKGDHLAPVLVQGPSGAAAKLGNKVSYSIARDAMEVYGGAAYFARVVGPAPVYATLNLAGTSGTTLVVNAKSVGDWANGATGLSVEVANGPAGASTRVLTIRLNGVIVETTPEYTTAAEFITWSLNSTYVTIVAGGGTASLPTVAAAANMASGTDDRASATDTHWKAALERFTAEYGPGQMTQLGRTTAQAHIDTNEVEQETGRVAVNDGPNTVTKATLLTAAAADRAGANPEFGALFAPWITYPGTSAGTVRNLPPSPFVAREIARNDAIYGTNQPSAGDWGRLGDALGLAATGTALTDLDYQDLNDAGINMIRLDQGVVTIFGWRTSASKITKPLDWMFSNQRLEMQIKAVTRAVGRDFLFRQIDGQGITLAAWNAALTDQMMRLYLAGALFPDPDDPRPQTAFIVETQSVNTEETLADGQLIAEIGYRPAPFAELVYIRITHVPVGTPIAA
jgi:hypothetical protein